MKKILICGASKNLGNYFFNKLKNFYQIYLFSRNIIQHNDFIKTDLSKIKETNDAFKKLSIKISKIDTIIFCVGDSKKKYGKQATEKDFDSSFKSNFYSFINLLNSYIKYFKKKPVKIIVISSIAGLKNINAPITYSIAKNALNYYCTINAKELAKNKIFINIISPGNILMKGNNWDKKLKKNKRKILNYINKNVPNKKFCDPDDILNSCRLIIEMKNSFVGSNIVIDGGQIL